MAGLREGTRAPQVFSLAVFQACDKEGRVTYVFAVIYWQLETGKEGSRIPDLKIWPMDKMSSENIVFG